MSGLLSRLAARAAGTALAPRADAGLAGYSGSGGFALEEGGLPSGPPARAVVPESPGTPAIARMPASEPAQTPAVPAPAQEVAAYPLDDAIAPLLSAMPPARMPTAAERTLAPEMPRVLSAAPAASWHDADGSRSASAHDAPSAFVAAGGVPEADVDRGPEPAPLMARGPAPAPLVPVPPLRFVVPVPGIAPQAASVDTEVHIHIGRIDVTAVPEAPAPRRSEPKVQAPMSLDAYLAQRGRP